MEHVPGRRLVAGESLAPKAVLVPDLRSVAEAYSGSGKPSVLSTTDAEDRLILVVWPRDMLGFNVGHGRVGWSFEFSPVSASDKGER